MLRSSVAAAPAANYGYYTTTGGQSSVNDARMSISRAGGATVDVGGAGTSLTLECFVWGNTTTNAQTTPTSANSYAGNATDGNILFDLDGFTTGRGGIGGFDNGIPYWGWQNAAGARTQVGNANLLVDAWRHVAYQFTVDTGLAQILGNGLLQATFDGPNGAINHNATTDDEDDLIGIAYEKLLDPGGFGYGGRIAMIRISNTLRYSVTNVGDPYTVPTAAFTNDANTMGLYLMEQSAPTADSSGNGNTLTLLGNPVPAWTQGGPFA